MAEGASNEKIAQSLKLNLGQVKTTNVRMYRKLGVGSRVEAINCARRRGLVPPL